MVGKNYCYPYKFNKINEFFKHEPKKFKLGVSLRIRPPLGQYEPTKLLNLGANRWALKMAFAASYTIKKKLTFD